MGSATLAAQSTSTGTAGIPLIMAIARLKTKPGGSWDGVEGANGDNRLGLSVAIYVGLRFLSSPRHRPSPPQLCSEAIGSGSPIR
jgi:hypothetical protein